MLPGAPTSARRWSPTRGSRVVSFTGSTEAGRAVGALAGQHLKRVHLELGGNSALVVLRGVDIDKAASVGAFGSFMHQGQICMTTGRHLVDAPSSTNTSTARGQRADSYRSATRPPAHVALGPIIDAAARPHPRHGHRDRRRPARRSRPAAPTGPVLPPDRPSRHTDERAGVRRGDLRPRRAGACLLAMDEAAKLAADSEYGLSLGILAATSARPRRWPTQIPIGVVHINDQTVADEAASPSAASVTPATAPASAARRTSRPTPKRSGSPSGADAPDIL